MWALLRGPSLARNLSRLELSSPEWEVTSWTHQRTNTFTISKSNVWTRLTWMLTRLSSRLTTSRVCSDNRTSWWRPTISWWLSWCRTAPLSSSGILSWVTVWRSGDTHILYHSGRGSGGVRLVTRLRFIYGILAPQSPKDLPRPRLTKGHFDKIIIILALKISSLLFILLK